MCRTEKKRKAKKNMIQQKSMIFHSFHWPPEYIGCLPDMIFDHDDSSSLGSSSYMNLPKTRQLTIPLCINIIIIIDVWLYLWHQCYIYIYMLCAIIIAICDYHCYYFICIYVLSCLWYIFCLPPDEFLSYILHIWTWEHTRSHITYFIFYCIYNVWKSVCRICSSSM